MGTDGAVGPDPTEPYAGPHPVRACHGGAEGSPAVGCIETSVGPAGGEAGGLARTSTQPLRNVRIPSSGRQRNLSGRRTVPSPRLTYSVVQSTWKRPAAYR